MVPFHPRPAASPRRIAAGVAALAVALSASAVLVAQSGRTPTPNYELAARWHSQKVAKLVFDLSVTPHWAETSERFWYAYETPRGRLFHLVDPVKRLKTPLWENARMAALLTSVTRIPYDAQHLPIEPSTVKWAKRDTAVRFQVEVPADAEIAAAKPAETAKVAEKAAETQQRAGAEPEADERRTRTLLFEYDLASATLTLLEDEEPPPRKPRWAQVSPDDRWVVFARGDNLFMMDAASYARAQKNPGDPAIQEVQLTTDGEAHYGFARRLTDEDRRQLRRDQRGDKHRDGPRVPAVTVYWSKDSKKFALIRLDQRKVADLWVINSLATPRPTLETYRYAMPGEVNVPQSELLVFDVETRQRVKVQADRFKDQNLQVATARTTARNREREKTEPQWVADSSDKLYFYRLSRDLRKVDVCLADSSTGAVTTLIEERLNTYIETRPLRLIGNGRELLHWSERDGWGHYYLYDGAGTLKHQVDRGEFVAGDIEHIDEKARVMYFTANGREPNEDPYYTHLYRIGLDGSGLTLLNPGNASHAATFSDSGRYFVDTSSRVDTAPASVLYDTTGARLLDLETTDVSALLEAGFKFPEPFTVKADDGVTDLYGVMYKPFDFDPNKKYPIIAFVYPGPQTESVTKTFSPRNQNVALAQMGFIVIEVGNRGGHPLRSKWYHTYGYGNLRDYGLADKKAAIEQLARRYPWIDLEKVGIYGHSGGGFMSTAAMLVYPDFFKVAVSSSGNHENNIYNRQWSEKHHGVKEVVDKDGNVRFEYSIETNSQIAANLKGHLLLVTGDMDDNVHMANTLRVADALIKANKRFDFFIFPGKRHSFGDAADYFFWLRANYFARHLLGAADDRVDILELQREKPQEGNNRPR